MRVIVSGRGCYNGIPVFQGDSGGVADVFSGGGGVLRGKRVISERLREICTKRFYDRREVVSFRVVCKKNSQRHNA